MNQSTVGHWSDAGQRGIEASMPIRRVRRGYAGLGGGFVSDHFKPEVISESLESSSLPSPQSDDLATRKFAIEEQ